MKEEDINAAQEIIREGGVVVMPTDTIYGIVCSADSKDAVDRIYKIKDRPSEKPCIVLISDIEQIRQFSDTLQPRTKNFLENTWPSSTSIILPTPGDEYEYLHRGKESLAFRLPEPEWLQNFIDTTGPIVAPSANISGKPPAKTIEDAREYFSDAVDFYLNDGKQEGEPSLLLELLRS